ncbi:hypothetical protein [Geitlerinema sp. PCC 7407]|uniref:hypothetical protein n=1 Tax=Geitlerinema sp. PCC 7407 TaxID=1173025 RepID=UPI00059C2978|nr:hypothetical protein [Geitlerinema sp. PCC 7407]
MIAGTLSAVTDGDRTTVIELKVMPNDGGSDRRLNVRNQRFRKQIKSLFQLSFQRSGYFTFTEKQGRTPTFMQ